MTIENICALEKIKKLKDSSQDIIYADPPYALGSTVLIGKDGKPYYKEAKDFMNKWDMPDEKFWEEFFQEANRVLKYGGRILFFGIDRQLMLFQYYAVAANLEIKQSLYWYFISNFPKATDLSKQIDKRLGVDRKVVGTEKRWGANVSSGRGSQNKNGYQETTIGAKEDVDITESNSELGQKYEGFKYSISPLKQVLETVMVFQKQTKNKSILDDVFAYEKGDKTVCPSIWAIDEGRVPIAKKEYEDNFRTSKDINSETVYNLGFKKSISEPNSDGRFPSQLFVSKDSADKIDKQSGVLTSGARKPQEQRVPKNENGIYSKGMGGGASRILHNIEYLDEELDLVIYSPKVSTFERKHGSENNHPTLKPIKLNYQIAKLLKTPNPQNIFFPFSGSGSEIIGFKQAGFDEKLFENSEISDEYVDIAHARIQAWEDLDINNLEYSKKHIEKRKTENSQQGSLF